MECPVNDSNGPQVFLLGKTYLPGKDHFYIKNDPVVHMASGERHSLLVTENGQAFAFGDNNSGQLGLGHTNATETVSCVKSLKFADAREKVQLAACGRESSLVATNFGSLYAFGSNSHGQLGFKSDKSIAVQSSPVQIVDARSNISWKQISMGAEHSCALTNDGIVYVWGSNEDGQCGQEHKYDRITTPTALQLDYAVSAISCGYYHTALITEDGRLFLFGNNDNRQLGRSIPETYRGPLEVTLPEAAKAVACGNQHTVVLTESGQVYVCGRGERGQLGLGVQVLATEHFELVDQNLPPQPIGIATGEGHTAILGSHGDLYVFGDGQNEFRPCFVEKFRDYYVSKVVCGGCQTVILARSRSGADEPPVEALTTRLSIDISHRQDQQPVDTSSHLRKSSQRHESNSESDEMSASMLSELLNTNHVEKNGEFQSMPSPMKSGSPRRNTDDSKLLKTTASNQSTANSRCDGRRSNRASMSDDDDEPLVDIRYSSPTSSNPRKPTVRIQSPSASDDEKHADEEDQSESSTTISRSSSASSDDDNDAMPTGSVDDLHHSFRSPQRLKRDNGLTTIPKSEVSFFSRVFRSKSSPNLPTVGHRNSRACVVM